MEVQSPATDEVGTMRETIMFVATIFIVLAVVATVFALIEWRKAANSVKKAKSRGTGAEAGRPVEDHPDSEQPPDAHPRW